jgi:hypothetical protein
LALKNHDGFSMLWKKLCARLKFSGISGRRAALWNCFQNQCAHWFMETVPGAQVAGTMRKSGGARQLILARFDMPRKDAGFARKSAIRKFSTNTGPKSS